MPRINQEDHQRHDQEINDVVDEISIVERGRAGFLGVRQGGIRLAIERNEQILEIHAVEQQANRAA